MARTSNYALRLLASVKAEAEKLEPTLPADEELPRIVPLKTAA
jgi:hypothetical protein